LDTAANEHTCPDQYPFGHADARAAHSDGDGERNSIAHNRTHININANPRSNGQADHCAYEWSACCAATYRHGFPSAQTCATCRGYVSED